MGSVYLPLDRGYVAVIRPTTIPRTLGPKHHAAPTLLLPFGQYLLSPECGPRDVKEKHVNHQENACDDEEVARVPEGDQVELTADVNPPEREHHEGPKLHRDPHIAHPGRDDDVPFDAHDCCERDHEEERSEEHTSELQSHHDL